MSERLDVIKHIHNQDEKVHEFDIDWLIEQAEHKEELELELGKENKRLEEWIDKLQIVHFVELQREKSTVERYEKALKQIAKYENDEDARRFALFAQRTLEENA